MEKEKEFLASILNIYSYVQNTLIDEGDEELQAIKGQAMVKATELYMWVQLFCDSKNRKHPEIKGMIVNEPKPA